MASRENSPGTATPTQIPARPDTGFTQLSETSWLINGRTYRGKDYPAGKPGP